jgi:hypothetical protein
MIDYAKYPPRWVDLSEVDVNDRTFQCRKVLRTHVEKAPAALNAGREKAVK